MEGEMRTVQITIPGTPVGKGRPRFTRQGHTYTPDKTREFERRVKAAFIKSGEATFKPNTKLILTVVAYMPIPASLPKKVKRKLFNEPHSKKPDLDNIIKAVSDGLNGIAFEDDSKIWIICGKKVYSDNPRTMVRITGEEDET